MSDPAALAAFANEISSFLAFEQVKNLEHLRAIWESTATDTTQHPDGEPLPTDVVVFCASAVLVTAEVVFSNLKKYTYTKGSDTPRPARHHLVLVLCGGIGHSTTLLHQAIAKHPEYSVLANQISQQPEARVLQAISEQLFELRTGTMPFPKGHPGSFSILVEDQSTNCGANAIKTREVLEAHGISSPRSIVVAQDPTMCRRTIASFEKIYRDRSHESPKLYSWPTFTPVLTSNNPTIRGHVGQEHQLGVNALAYDTAKMGHIDSEGFWAMPRFLDLILGEIPRLRDDVNGYGPNGKGFIVSVDIPENVEKAWEVLDGAMKGQQGRR